MKRIVLFVFLFFCLYATPAFADESYVLPYPSAMPGSSLYKMHLIWEKIVQYWYFGNFGQFEYNLKQSDKYLVEAKTLFEYQQYLLGYNALIKSDEYFLKVSPYLYKAQKEGKEISPKKMLFRQAIAKHDEILEEMKKNVPAFIIWQPEKAIATKLNLLQSISNSEILRNNTL